ncbi:MAG: hypothetical protein HYY03_04140 [Chloroflexi bacterium]|nr:hypothetical protein [Chloroflexota bacterium]
MKDVATVVGLPLVTVMRTESRTQQKEITDDNRRRGVEKRFENQRGSMRINQDLAGGAIVLIDDLYGSGGSMLECARAAREAGAGEVLGLAITKQRLFEGVRMTSNV